MKHKTFLCAGAIVSALLGIAENAGAQVSIREDVGREQTGIREETGPRPLFGVRPWEGGTAEDGLFHAQAGTSVPFSSYSITASKNNIKYNGVLVGASPFATTLSGMTIPVVVVPVAVTIGTTTFDATAPEACDSGATPISRFNNSPLVQPSALSFDGQSVGTFQFNDGFRRAEFWSLVGGSSAYTNSLSFTTAPVLTISSATVGTHGKVLSTGCKTFGLLANKWLDSYLTGTVIPSLQNSGTVSPTQFVIFLLHNVMQSTSDPPNIITCCILGYHSATGSPAQTYAVVNWDSTATLSAFVDAVPASHEIAEWMDDPLGTNLAPSWGNIGQVLGCHYIFEDGDPLSGKDMPTITMNGFTYHVQEIAFFSWFFNSASTPSLGAGGKFSGNGSFGGPAKACPFGGTN